MKDLDKTKNLIETIIREVVTAPDEVAVFIKSNSEEERSEITIKVANSDVRLAIGTGGLTAEALRRIALLSARNNGCKDEIYLTVAEPN